MVERISIQPWKQQHHILTHSNEKEKLIMGTPSVNLEAYVAVEETETTTTEKTEEAAE